MVPTPIRSGHGGPPKISGILRSLRLFILLPPKQKSLGQFVFISWWMIFKPFMLSLSFKTETAATTEFNGMKQMLNFWCLFNWRKNLIKFYFQSHLFCSIKVPEHFSAGLNFDMFIACFIATSCPSLGACNSHTKPMSRCFYRPVYF